MTGSFPKVVAYVDFGPLNTRQDAQVARQLADRRSSFEDAVAEMLTQTPGVPAVIIATTIFDFHPKDAEVLPAYRSGVQFREKPHDLPNQIKKLLLTLFENRRARKGI